jgi:ABC-type lipoprotein release transport system permease subunit
VVSIWLLGDGIDLSRWAEGLTAYGVGTEIVPVIRTKDLIIPTLVAIITAVLASLWPALRAVRIRPADAVRHI